MLFYLFSTGAKRHVIAWAVSGIFVCFTVPISLHDLHMHCAHYVSPLQRHMIRILLMPLIYSVESWISLRFSASSVYLGTARECYEA